MDCKYITPSVTIFKADGTVDLEAMERHFDFLIQGGVDGILILGSIGEFFSMPMEEKKEADPLCSKAYRRTCKADRWNDQHGDRGDHRIV